MTRIGTTRPPSFTGISAFGCTSCLSCTAPCFTTISQRITFMPPVVLPAQPLMKEISSSITGSAPGQAWNEVVA